MQIPLKAIIFDYGNVISQPQNGLEVQGMAGILDLPREEFETVYWRFRVAYDEAQFEPREYWNRVAGLAGRTVSESQIERLIALDSLSWMYPRTAVTDWAGALHRTGFPIALLSNMPVMLRDALQRCAWLPEFDHRTLSCDLKISKPAREIYEHCLHGLGCPASEVLFIDDREPNVRAARALGMHAVQFTTVAGLAGEILSRFDTPVPFVGTVGKTHEPDQ
jgi:putative hydrolase of the HAD superfamily